MDFSVCSLSSIAGLYMRTHHTLSDTKQNMTCGDTNQVAMSTAAKVTRHRTQLQKHAQQAG